MQKQIKFRFPRWAILPLLLLAGAIQAQTITAYRYWFNDDVSTLTTVNVTAGQVAEVNATLNSAALPVGYHRATIQFQDDEGIWSAPVTKVFTQRGPTIDAIAYWFNDDPSTYTVTEVTPQAELDLSASLNASSLSIGHHRVTLRMRDLFGEWSSPIMSNFTRMGGAVAGYEFWIDDEIADRVAGTIGPGDVVELIADLPVPTTWGDHLFTIRFHDQQNGWSVPLSSTFTYFTSIEELPGITEVILFPNPATDRLGLRLNAANSSTLRVELLDLHGQLVQGTDGWSVYGTTYRYWDISSIAPGTYLLRLSDDRGSRSIPFIKE